MRHYLLLILIAASSLVSATNNLGQSRAITEADLAKLISDATQKRKGLPQRHRMSTTGYSAGESSEALTEFGPDDTYHYVVIRRSKGVETRTEGIRIGKVLYTRGVDGKWTREEMRSGPGDGYGIGSGIGSGNGSGSAQISRPETTVEYLYLGKEKIDGKITDHYRKTRVVRFTSSTPIFTRTGVYDYWFGADGQLVKEAQEDILGNAGRSFTRVTKYEYDKDIRITAPIPD